jgi:hypothetical protein
LLMKGSKWSVHSTAIERHISLTALVSIIVMV